MHAEAFGAWSARHFIQGRSLRNATRHVSRPRNATWIRRNTPSPARVLRRRRRLNKRRTSEHGAVATRISVSAMTNNRQRSSKTPSNFSRPYHRLKSYLIFRMKTPHRRIAFTSFGKCLTFFHFHEGWLRCFGKQIEAFISPKTNRRFSCNARAEWLTDAEVGSARIELAIFAMSRRRHNP